MIQIQVYLMVQTFINKKLFFKQDKVEKSMVKIEDFAMFRNVFFFFLRSYGDEKVWYGLGLGHDGISVR